MKILRKTEIFHVTAGHHITMPIQCYPKTNVQTDQNEMGYILHMYA